MNLDDIRRVRALIIGSRVEEIREETPANFSALLHYNSLRLFHRRTGIPEDYQPGAPVSREMIEQVRSNSMIMLPFMVVKGDADGSTPITLNAHGYGDLPEDFFFPIVVSYKRLKNEKYEVVPIEIYSNNDFIHKVDDVLEKATVDWPMATFNSVVRHSGITAKIQVAPVSIQRISMTYVKIPATPVYAVKYENGMNVYDPANSVQLEWDDSSIHSIIALMVETMGITIGAADVAQYQFNLNAQGK